MKGPHCGCDEVAMLYKEPGKCPACMAFTTGEWMLEKGPRIDPSFDERNPMRSLGPVDVQWGSVRIGVRQLTQ